MNNKEKLNCYKSLYILGLILLTKSLVYCQNRTLIPENPFDLYMNKWVKPHYILLGDKKNENDPFNFFEEEGGVYNSCLEAIKIGKKFPVSVEISQHSPFGSYMPDSIFLIRKLNFLFVNKSSWYLPPDKSFSYFNNLKGISFSNIIIEDSFPKIPSSVFDIKRLEYLSIKDSKLRITPLIINASNLKYLEIKIGLRW